MGEGEYIRVCGRVPRRQSSEDDKSREFLRDVLIKARRETSKKLLDQFALEKKKAEEEKESEAFLRTKWRESAEHRRFTEDPDALHDETGTGSPQDERGSQERTEEGTTGEKER